MTSFCASRIALVFGCLEYDKTRFNNEINQEKDPNRVFLFEYSHSDYVHNT